MLMASLILPVVGCAGEQGLKGPKGDTGARGTQGEQGEQGSLGLQGETGPKGSTGAKGATGSKGTTGATGEQGIQGERGPAGVGYPGATGAIGPIGPQGPPGMGVVAVDLEETIDLNYDWKISYPYNYDIRAGIGDITTNSFDYSYGDAPLGDMGPGDFRIHRLNADGTDSWAMSCRIGLESWNVDTDFGPYEVASFELLVGVHHYEFTLNRSNGEWDLVLDGNPVNFIAHAHITGRQADGIAIPPGDPTPNPYFSDESPEAYANAKALGWWVDPYTKESIYYSATRDGVGGTGAYRLVFKQAPGGSVGNIVVTNY